METKQVMGLSASKMPETERRQHSLKRWVIDQVSALAVALGDASVSQERLLLYAEDLCDIPQEILAHAFVKVRREYEYPKLPPVAHIRKACGQQFDGRPGPEEAWARMPKGERMELDTVVWCEEERDAYEACRPLLRADDLIAARMCFLEKYRGLVEHARIRGIALVWSVSCGFDKSDRVVKIAEAVSAKRLPANVASAWIPVECMTEFAALLPAADTKGLLLGGTVEAATKRLPGFHGLLQKVRGAGILPEGSEPADKPKYAEQTPEQAIERKKLLEQQKKIVAERFGKSGDAA